MEHQLVRQVATAGVLVCTALCHAQPAARRGAPRNARVDTDLRRIVCRARLDMRHLTDQSFIVHEMVHWLQHLERGPALEATCESVQAAKRAAYAVQNTCLARFKQWQRVGEVLRFTFCNASAGTQPDEPTVRFDASMGPITATHAAPVASQPR